jgi:beta-aspartyl-peptidase (threonine type)
LNPSFSRTRILLSLSLIGLALFLTLRLRGERTSEEKVRTAVQKVLDEQQEAWNRGDLDAFMSGYWHSDELTFFSGAEVQHGWQETFDRYRRTYQAEGKEMGTLKFEDVRIDPTGPKSALVRGRWGLTFRDGKTAGGLYTLLFREEPQGWCVVHDHTSRGEPPVRLPPPAEAR